MSWRSTKRYPSAARSSALDPTPSRWVCRCSVWRWGRRTEWPWCPGPRWGPGSLPTESSTPAWRWAWGRSQCCWHSAASRSGTSCRWKCRPDTGNRHSSRSASNTEFPSPSSCAARGGRVGCIWRRGPLVLHRATAFHWSGGERREKLPVYSSIPTIYSNPWNPDKGHEYRANTQYYHIFDQLTIVINEYLKGSVSKNPERNVLLLVRDR